MSKNESARISADILIAYIGTSEFERAFGISDTNKSRAEAIAEAFNIIHSAVISALPGSEKDQG